jgi:hypothetical protein
MGRNSVLERTPRKCLQPVMFLAFKNAQHHEPHVWASRPENLQENVRVFSCASPQLASEFTNKFMVLKGQAPTNNERMQEASVPFPLFCPSYP